MYAPFFINTAQLNTFREGNENYVKVTFGYLCPPDIPVPTVTLMMSRTSYKYIFKQFQAFLAKQEEGKIGGEEIKI